jgi:hypothetical protein
MEVRGLTVKLARAQRLGDVDSAEPDEVLPARLLGIARDLERAVLSARVARDVHAEPAPSPSGARTTAGVGASALCVPERVLPALGVDLRPLPRAVAEHELRERVPARMA